MLSSDASMDGVETTDASWAQEMVVGMLGRVYILLTEKNYLRSAMQKALLGNLFPFLPSPPLGHVRTLKKCTKRLKGSTLKQNSTVKHGQQKAHPLEQRNTLFR